MFASETQNQQQIMLDISKVEEHHLEALKRMIPYGYGKAIRKRVRKTNGKRYTENSIHRGLTKKHLSKRILNAAIEYAREQGSDVDTVFRNTQRTVESW